MRFRRNVGRESADYKAGLGLWGMGLGEAIDYTQRGIVSTEIYDNMQRSWEGAVRKQTVKPT
jgi:hypothetical protein